MIEEGIWPEKLRTEISQPELSNDITRIVNLAKQIGFVAGAKWWEFHSTGGTMWQSDQRLAEEEAERRYEKPDNGVDETQA